jgi:hypothetical protein
MSENKPRSDAGSESEGGAGYSSPACQLHEADPAYAGYLGDDELIELLNTLLEGERAGDAVAAEFLAASPSAEARALLEAVGRDEARFAAMLARLVGRLGGTPSERVGSFRDKALAIEGFAPRLEFLNRGQAWVVRKLAETLPRIRDDRIHSALKGMLGAHEANIARCEALLKALA